MAEIETPKQDTNKQNTSAKNTEKHENVPELIAHIEENSNVSILRNPKLINDLVSSDEDLPLSNYTKSVLKEIGLLDLNKPRDKSCYRNFYKTPETSDDEQQPGTSKEKSADKENYHVQQGDFMLVNFHAVKGKVFKYACVVNDLHEDGEIRVTFLRSMRKRNTFRLDKSDVADIDYTDILDILSEPRIISKRGQQYYVFKNNVDVSEK